MKQYLLTHIDAVITTTFGVFITILSIQKRTELALSTNKMRRALPVLGPCVLAFGLIQLFIPSTKAEPKWQAVPTKVIPSNRVELRAEPKLQVVSTDDGISSVVFPLPPIRNESTDRAQGLEVHRITYEVDTEDGRLNFRLSYSDFPAGSPPMTAEARFDAIRNFFAQGGAEILEDATDQDGIRKLAVSQKKNGSRIAMRIGVMPNGLYRAMVTSLEGCHEDPRITPFLNSFSMNKTAKPTAPKN